MATEIKVGRPSVTTWLLWECLTPEVQRKLWVLMPLAWEPPNSNHRRMKLDKGVAGGHFRPGFAKAVGITAVVGHQLLSFWYINLTVTIFNPIVHGCIICLFVATELVFPLEPRYVSLSFSFSPHSARRHPSATVIAELFFCETTTLQDY